MSAAQATMMDIVTAATNTYGGPGAIPMGQGWTLVSTSNNTDVGYYGEAWLNESTGELIIANRGTDPTNLQNLTSDTQLSVGMEATAVQAANDFAIQAIQVAQQQMSQAGGTLTNVDLTGHSLGGYESQAQTADLVNIADGTLTNPGVDLSGIFFTNVSLDAPGITGITQPTNSSLYASYNFSAQGDLIHDVNSGDYLSGTVSVSLPIGGPWWQSGGLIDAGGTLLGAGALTGGLASLLGLGLSSVGAANALADHSSLLFFEANGTPLGDATIGSFSGKSSADLEDLYSATPPSTVPVYDAGGYDQSGFDANGYNIFGLNAQGQLDPNIAIAGGVVNQDMLSDGSTMTVNVAADGSSVAQIQHPDDGSDIFNYNAVGQFIGGTMTSEDGATLNLTANPTTQEVSYSETQNGVELTSGVLQYNKDGSASESSSDYNASGQTTSTDASTLNANGSSTDMYTNYDDGSVQGQVITSYSSSGQETTTASGVGNDVYDNGASITLANGSQADIHGDDNAVTGSHATFDDAAGDGGNSFSGSYDNVVVDGAGDKLSGSGDTADVEDGGSLTLTSGGDTVNVGAGASFTDVWANGGSTINAAAGASVEISDAGASGYSDAIYAVNDPFVTVDSWSNATIVGAGDTVKVSNGDNITASGDTFDAGDVSFALTNSGTVTDTISGDANVISATNNSIFTLDGSGDVVSGNYGSITLDAGDAATISDSDSTITVDAGASLDSTGYSGQNTINLASDATLEVGNNRGYADTVNTSNNVDITLESGAAATFVGGGDAVVAEGGNVIGLSNGTVEAGTGSYSLNGNNDVYTGTTGDTLTINGQSDIFNVSGATVNVSGNTSAADVFNGDDNALSVGNYTKLDLNGTGDTANGYYDTIELNAGDAATLSNSDSTITVDAGASLDSSSYSGGNTINLASDATLEVGNNRGYTDTINTSDNDITLDGGAAATIVGGGDAITAAGSNTITATGDQITITGAAAGTETIRGGSDVIDTSNEALVLSVTSNTADTIVGDNNTISADNYNTFTLDGTGDVTSGYYDNITLDAGDAATISDSDSTITVDAGASLDSTGYSGQNTINLASDATLEVGNNRGYADTVNTSNNVDITLESGAAATFVGGGDAVVAEGGNVIGLSNGTVEAGTGSYSLNGNNDVYTGTTGDTLTINGQSDIFNVSGATVNVSGNTSAADVFNGDDNALSVGNYTKLDLNGTGDTANGYYDTIELNAGDAATLSNSDSTITVDAGASLDSTGYSGQNTINLASDATLEVGNNRGYADTVNTSNNVDITLDSGAAATFVGGGDAVVAEGGNVIGLSNGTVEAGTGSYSLNGNNDVYTGTTGDTLTINGQSDIFNVSGATVNVSGNTSAADVFNGDDNALSVGNYTKLDLNGTGDTANGYYDTIELNAGDAATLSNSDSTITVDAGASLDSSSYSGGNTINLASDATLEVGNNRGYTDTINTSDNDITLDGGAAATIVGGGDAITAAGSNTITATGDQITITGAAAGTETIRGGSDVIDTSNEALVLSVTSNTADTIVGDNNTISADNYNTFTLDGTGDVTSGYYDNITLDAGDAATISDSDSTITVDAGASLDSTGYSGQNTINLASDATLEVGNNRGYADTVNTSNNVDITLESGAAATFVGGGDAVVAEGGNVIGLSNGTVEAGTGSYSLNGNNDVYTGTTGDTLTINGQSDIFNVSGATVNVSGNTSAADVFNGDDNALSVGNYTKLDLNGTGDTANGYYDTIELNADDAATLSNSDSTITVDAGASLYSDSASGGNTINVSAGSSLEIANNYLTDTVNADVGQIIQLDQGASINLVGNGVTVDAIQNGTVSVDGQGNVIDISNATINISGDEGVTIAGSNDRIEGGDGDSFVVTGTGDSVYATNSSVEFDGANTDDDVYGAGDTGSNWFAPDPDDSGDTGGYGYGYGYGYGLVDYKGRAPTAAKMAAAEGSRSVYEGAAWADKTVTWSLADAGGAFTGGISSSAEQSSIEQAFQAWAKASGLNFDEVAAGSPADIEVGFSSLDTSATSAIGLTRYASTNGQLNSGVLVELEDPAQLALSTNASGQLVYTDTGASFEQVALHEIGHALGLADNSDVGSIMNALLDASNPSIDAMDVANVDQLYGIQRQSGASAAQRDQAGHGGTQLHQLIQAMGAFDGSPGPISNELPIYDQHFHTLTASVASSHAHAA